MLLGSVLCDATLSDAVGAAPEILGVPWYWFAIGLAAQVMFFGRFLLQWIATERAKRSVFPMSFWYLSVAGSALLLVYAIWYLADPIIILGQSTGMIVYLRNLYYRRLERQASS